MSNFLHLGPKLSSCGHNKAFNIRSHHQSISQTRAPKHEGSEIRSNSSDPKRISSTMNPSRSRSNAGLFEADEIDNDHPPLLMSSIDGPLSTQVSLFSFNNSLIIANTYNIF